jgi:hypothetical protein
MQRHMSDRNWFLTAFAKIAKSDYYLRRVCPPVCPDGTRLQMDRLSRNFIFKHFSKSIYNVKVSLTSDKNKKNGYFTCRPIYNLLSYLATFFLEWKMFQTKAVDKIKRDIWRSINFFRKSCRLWDNVKYIVLRGRSQMTIWRMRIVLWIPKATHTHTHTHTHT